MRMLLLCAAVFAGGLVAGAVLWPSGGGGRVARERATRVTPEPSRPAPGGRGARTDGAREVGEAGDGGATARDTPLRVLAGEASAALDRTLRSEAAATFLAGDGRIEGTVRDLEDHPVAGVVVTASPVARPFELALADRRARERPHEDRDVGDVARGAIEEELWRRHVRVVARTDADGRYELRGLAKAGHTLTAFHDDYEVKPTGKETRIEPDAVVDFVARPVVGVRVDVLLPDGTPADYAWVNWRGSGGAGWETWRPEPGHVRLPLGICTVKAQTWVPDALQSAEVEREVGLATREDPLVLRLESRRMLTARLVPPAGLAMPDAVEFRLRRVEGGDDVDPASLGPDDTRRKASARAPGRGVWFDLEPGRYLVAAFLAGRRLLGHAVAQVGEASSEVDLPMDPLPDGRGLVVTLLAPGGAPIREGADFAIVAGSGPKARRVPCDVLRQTDGTWLLLPGDGADAGGPAVVRAQAPYGVVTVEFDLARPRPLTVRFEEPARLRLEVADYAGCPVEGRLYAAVVGDAGVAAARQVQADGACELRGVQPGECAILLFVRQGKSRWPILRRPIRLRPGDGEERVAVPPLHTLRVRPDPKLRAKGVRLHGTDEAIGALRRDAAVSQGVAVFDALAAGAYEIECAGRRKKLRVPAAPEVTIP